MDKVLHKLQLLDLSKHPINNNVTHEIGLNKTDAVDTLTDREKQVLKLIAEGFSTKMISGQLKITINTVETHRRHLLEKLDAKNSMELIRKAFRLFLELASNKSSRFSSLSFTSRFSVMVSRRDYE